MKISLNPKLTNQEQNPHFPFFYAVGSDNFKEEKQATHFNLFVH